MTQDMITASDLKQLVSTWVDKTFNYISLENAEKVMDNMLFEHIRSNCTQNTAEEYLNENVNIKEEFENSDSTDELEFLQEEYEDEYREYAEQDHYPMWSTLFEFRNEPSETVIEAAIEAGFGIVESTDNYNTMLFVKGAGYSFYGTHWIPLYLGLPWISSKDYSGIDYSSQ